MVRKNESCYFSLTSFIIINHGDVKNINLGNNTLAGIDWRLLGLVVLVIAESGCIQNCQATTPLPGKTETSVKPVTHAVFTKDAGSNQPAPLNDSAMIAQPHRSRAVSCWGKTFGTQQTSEALKPSLTQPVPGCNDCAKLRVGPKALELHPEVLRKLRDIEVKLPEPSLSEPKMWVNAGHHKGPINESMHNQGLAVDLVICGFTTIETAQQLREAGFSCVIEYYDHRGKPCHMAHGDMRNTPWAKGAYAPGGWKSKSCPRRAFSKTPGCGNQTKEQWRYQQ